MMRPTLKTYDLERATDAIHLALEGDGPVVGIDLGTSNSCACVLVDGSPVVVEVADAQGSISRTLPSVVSYDDRGGAQVGKSALMGRADEPRRTVFGAKRFIGRDYESTVVQDMLSRFPYRIVPGGLGKVAVEIDGKRINLTSISARILQQLKRAVSQRLGRDVNRAVITVPAFYNDNQRQAVVIAGRLAGLQVERVINEPTAAAIAYGLHRSRARRLVVYDLGGGTFDVSVMAVEQDSLTVKATA
ncbi:MAG: Hsp70 family protein, partial [Myxococcota bacterium]